MGRVVRSNEVFAGGGGFDAGAMGEASAEVIMV